MTQARPNKSALRSLEAGLPQVGERAPGFAVDMPTGPVTVAELAAGVGTLALVSLDSYRFHPG